MDTELVDRIEAQRAELEANVAKLRQALKHWQILELDYEGLKDEFLGLPEHATKDDYIIAAQDFEPQKVDNKELNELVEPTKGKVRRPSQVVDVLEKRVDYVLRNITSLRDQIARVEKQRNALLLAKTPEHADEAGLPIAEITEELDDDGNVLSSKVMSQSDTAEKVLDVLDKAKITTNDGTMEHEASSAPAATASSDNHVSVTDSNPGQEDSDDESTTSDIISAGASQAALHQPTNNEDTEEEAQFRQEMLQYGLDEIGNIVAELDIAEGEDGKFDDGEEDDIDDLSDLEDEDIDDYISDDDSEDDSGRLKGSLHSEKYKRQMEELQKELGFNMANVGPTPDLPAEVKAQMQTLPPSEVQEYINRLPPALRKQVEDARPSPAEAARKAAIARAEAAQKETDDVDQTAAQRPKKKSKKKVAFAPELDIAPEASLGSKPNTTSESIAGKDTSQPRLSTTSETVVERASTASVSIDEEPTPTPSQQQQSKKKSRFKAARVAQPQTPASLFPPPMDFPESQHQRRQPTPEGPPGKTIASVLVEHSDSENYAPPPSDGESGDFDEELQQRQIALEHHQLRNRMIHERGGYVQGGEQENWGDETAAPEIIDEKTGQPKKISRFKAARMRV